MLVDTGNGGALRWAMTVAFAELRLVDDPPPVAMVHGFTGATTDPDQSTMDNFGVYFEDEFDPIDGAVIRPSLTETGTIRENAELLEGHVEDLLDRTGAAQLNLVAHSFGGLASRQHAFDHPGEVRSLAMVATPNGGTRLADILCGNRKVPFLLRVLSPVPDLLDHLTDQFGPCDGPGDGLFQLQQRYVQDVFNRLVPDRRGTDYFTIAGQGNHPGNVLLDGEDDGTVSVASVRYLRPDSDDDPNPDHPGLHDALAPAYERTHSGLIDPGSEAMPRALCQLYPSAAVCDDPSAFSATSTTASVPPAAVEAGGGFEVVASAGATIDAGSSAAVPVAFEGAPAATLLVLGDTPGLVASIGGVTLEATDVFGSPALGAELTAPADGTLQLTNPGTEPAVALVMVAVQTQRVLDVTASPALASAGEAVALSATISETDPEDAPRAQVSDDTGVVVADVALAPVGDGSYQASFVAPGPGPYQVAASVEGARPRWATALFSVASGAATIAGGFSEELVVGDDGLAEALVLRPNLTIGQPGAYRLAGRLLDIAGTQVATAGATGELAGGAQSLALSFPGVDIFESGSSGPYRLVDVVLSRDDPAMSLEDDAADLGLTAAYDVAGFAHATVEIDLDAFSDQGVDSDSDGRFDRLDIAGSVRVDTGGSYAINARLVAPDGTEIGEAQTVTTFAAGANTFGLSFAGEAIGRAGRNGPYTVEDLSVYSVSDSEAVGYLVTAHRTGPYLAGEFEGDAATFSVDDVTVAEGSTGTTEAVFTVTLSSPADQLNTVDYATVDGTATAPDDYTAVSGTLAFAAGETTKTVTVDVVADTIDEPDETFVLALSNPLGATLADPEGTATITDDDTPAPAPPCSPPSGPLSGPLHQLGLALGPLGTAARALAATLCAAGL